MMRVGLRFGWLGLIALQLAASPGPGGGELVGRLLEADGMRPKVQFRYHRENAGEGRVSTKLRADGERFAGEYLRITGQHPTSKVNRFFLSWSSTVYDEYRVTPSGLPWVRTQTTIVSFRERHRGAVIATLIGDRGGRMRCRFDLEDPKSGLPGGAQGACQTSSGETIKIP